MFPDRLTPISSGHRFIVGAENLLCVLEQALPCKVRVMPRPVLTHQRLLNGELQPLDLLAQRRLGSSYPVRRARPERSASAMAAKFLEQIDVQLSSHDIRLLCCSIRAISFRGDSEAFWIRIWGAARARRPAEVIRSPLAASKVG